MSNFYDIFESVALRELIESIEDYHKSKLHEVEIYGDIFENHTKFYIEFILQNGDREEVCMKTINTYDNDQEIFELFNEFAEQYRNILTDNYNIDCFILGCFYQFKTKED